jgi:glycerophosphoryl diester phosphodiesterase
MPIHSQHWFHYLIKRLGVSLTKKYITKHFVAHRGANNIAPNNVLMHLPENTIHSLREAFRVGANFVECDIHKTIDDELIVLHDDTIHRTATFNPKLATSLSENHFLSIRHKKVDTLSFKEELSQVDVGAYADFLDKKFINTRIPLLKEFLLELNGFPDRHLIVELKPGDLSIIDVLKKMIKQAMIDYQLTSDQIVFISFDFELIKQSKGQQSQFKHFFLTTVSPSDDDIRPDPSNPQQQIGTYYRVVDKAHLDQVIQQATAANLDGLDVEYDSNFIDDDFVSRIHSAGLQCAVWTYAQDDTLEMAKKMLAVGADLINTNQPELLFNQLEEDIEKNPIASLKPK